MQEQTLIQDNPGATEGMVTKLAKALLTRQLRKLSDGRLRLIDAGSVLEFGGGTRTVTVRVHDRRFYQEILFGGSLGAGEAYALGYWSCDDLTQLVRLMVVNRRLTDSVDSGPLSRLAAPFLRLLHALQRNTLRGAERNIAAHYDLG